MIAPRPQTSNPYMEEPGLPWWLLGLIWGGFAVGAAAAWVWTFVA